MLYWMLNTKTNEPAICKNVRSAAALSNLNINTLNYHLTRKKRDEVNKNNWRIVKMLPRKDKK